MFIYMGLIYSHDSQWARIVFHVSIWQQRELITDIFSIISNETETQPTVREDIGIPRHIPQVLC